MDELLQGQWWNFAKEQWEVNPKNAADLTDEEARQYIMQNEAAQNIYQIHRSLGKSVIEALLETLLAQDRAYKRRQAESIE